MAIQLKVTQLESVVDNEVNKVRINMNDGISHLSLLVTEGEAAAYSVGQNYSVVVTKI